MINGWRAHGKDGWIENSGHLGYYTVVLNKMRGKDWPLTLRERFKTKKQDVMPTVKRYMMVI